MFYNKKNPNSFWPLGHGQNLYCCVTDKQFFSGCLSSKRAEEHAEQLIWLSKNQDHYSMLDSMKSLMLTIDITTAKGATN